MKTTKLVVLFWISLFLLVLMNYTAEAHENEVWKHMTENSGPIIGQKHCPGFVVWYNDMDSDGEVDKCTGVRLIHETLHVAPVQMTMSKDYEGNLRPDCSCNLIENSY